MPSDNVALALALFERWGQGNFSSTEWAHPEIEFVLPDLPGSEPRTGVIGMGESWGEFLAAFDEYTVEAEDHVELEGGRVLVLGLFGGRGKRSGLDVRDARTKGAAVVHVRDGRVTKLECYFNRERALADLGLAEERRP